MVTDLNGFGWFVVLIWGFCCTGFVDGGGKLIEAGGSHQPYSLACSWSCVGVRVASLG